MHEVASLPYRVVVKVGLHQRLHIKGGVINVSAFATGLILCEDNTEQFATKR